MGKLKVPHEYTVTWSCKVVALSGADAARKALCHKPAGICIATVHDAEHKVDVLIRPDKEKPNG